MTTHNALTRLTRYGLLTFTLLLSIFSFIFSWNELMYALVLTRKVAKTAPAMAVGFMEGYHLPYGKIMATSTLIVIPVIVFALIASKHLIRGLTMGAVK